MVFYCRSTLKDDVIRTKSELTEQVEQAMGVRIHPGEFSIGWVTIRGSNRNIKTSNMVAIAKPDLHDCLCPLPLHMANITDSHPITPHWAPAPVQGHNFAEQNKIDKAIVANREEFKSRIYANVGGLPPDADLYTILPQQSFMFGKEGEPKTCIVAQIITHSVVQIGNNVILSPVTVVSHTAN